MVYIQVKDKASHTATSTLIGMPQTDTTCQVSPNMLTVATLLITVYYHDRTDDGHLR